MTQIEPENPPAESTPEGDTPPAAAEDAGIDWSQILDDWLDYGTKVLGRYSAHAKTTVKAVEEKRYGRDDLLDDVAWFWKRAAEDASEALAYVKGKLPDK